MTERDPPIGSGGSIIQEDSGLDDPSDNVTDTTRMLEPEPEARNAGGERAPAVVQINNDEEGEEEDDDGRDNAVGAEAQNLLNMQNEISRPMSILGFLRRGNFFLILYFIPVTVSLITVLIVDWNSECDRPLKPWACTQVAIQSVMIIVHILFLHKIHNPENERLRHTSPLYIINKILNFLWFTWFIVGMVWTFQALSANICTSSAPFLFRMCFSLMIIQIIILSLGVLFCCCSCVVLILRVVVNPIERAAAPRGASDELIRSLPTKRFRDGMIKKEDASCAICLSDYEEDEVVRFLPCNHHYHRNCVDKWLVTNKACPFCKRNVDEPPPPPTNSAQNNTASTATSTATSPPATTAPPSTTSTTSPPPPSPPISHTAGPPSPSSSHSPSTSITIPPSSSSEDLLRDTSLHEEGDDNV